MHEESPECITNLYSKYQKTLIKERREALPLEGSAVLIMGHQADEKIKAGIPGELSHQHTVVPIPAAPGRWSGFPSQTLPEAEMISRGRNAYLVFSVTLSN